MAANSHRLSAAFAVAALAASFASLADDARGLLERMERALASRNYQGTFVHEHDGQTETLRIVHRAEGGGFAERLVSLDGSGREVIRRDGELRAYFPDQRAVLVESDPNTGLLLTGLQGLDSAGQMYRLSEEPRTRISGREARVLVVEPQDDLRYGYRVWIDESSAMPLKTQLTTAGGRVVEQLVFTDLSLPARVADVALQPAFSTHDFRLLRHGAAAASAPRQAADTTWDAADLPPGFRLVANSTRMMGDSPRAVTHLVFSDGLASVSVFVEPRTRASDSAPAALAPPAETRLGSSSAVSTEVDGHRVTAIGEVPPATVRAIAGSLRPGFAPSARGGPGAGSHR
jgi:sigma-E factor negative regulatory protein RseB